jgi:thiol-disulfide isomerase/thioredoxin
MQRRIVIGLMLLAMIAAGALTFSRSRAEISTTQPATISPQAREILNQIRDAYSSLKSLSITGTIQGHLDIDGVKSDDAGTFTGLYAKQGLFRSEMKDATTGNSSTTQPSGDAMVGNTGDKIYLYFPQQNRYQMVDAPKGKIDLTALGGDISDLLRNQDLSLMLAMADDAGAQLTQEAVSAARVDDVKIDGQVLPAILLSYPRYDMTIAVDPQKHLVRRAIADVSKNSRLEGAKDVKAALLTMDFLNKPGASIDSAQFAWAPPPGAQLLAADDSGANLEGKPTPAFDLTSLDGKDVSSDSLKGSVYVLDFWATYCGPCIASLPHLDALYQDYKSKGVKFFAVDTGEDKDTVQKFVTDTKLGIPVLLDPDGKASDKYVGDGGIPLTVVVGKDGVVVKSGFIQDENRLRPIIDSAMNK